MTFHFGFDILHRNYTVILVLNQCNDNTLKSTVPQRNRVSIFTFTSSILAYYSVFTGAISTLWLELKNTYQCI